MKNLGIKDYWLLTVIYIAVQAIGMAVMFYGFDIVYASSAMMYVLIFFETALALLIVFFVRRYSLWEEVGFGKISWLNLLWILPLLVLVGIPTVNPSRWIDTYPDRRDGFDEELRCRRPIWTPHLKRSQNSTPSPP